MTKIRTKECYICGGIFSFYPRIGYANIVCSRKCNGKHQKNIGNKPPTYSGEAHPSWKGGRNIHLMHGKVPYWRIVVDKKRVYEHRYVMEQHLGRKLKSSEIVHHINHDSLDNRIENLQLMSNAEHTLHHHKGSRYKR